VSETIPASRSGGCLCGAVTYRVTGPLREVIVCHCGRCRRQHGHVAAYTDAAMDDVTVSEGGALTWYLADDRQRGFCNRCGASLFWRRTGGDRISIAAGTLDAPTGLETAAHIFVDSKGDYYEIADALPRHARGRADGPPLA
jgi:hypothetical protein